MMMVLMYQNNSTTMIMCDLYCSRLSVEILKDLLAVGLSLVANIGVPDEYGLAAEFRRIELVGLT
jgi:hypothetical protein